MAFINSTIDPDALPAFEDAVLKQVQPDYLKVLRIEWMITSVFFLLGAGALIFFIQALRHSAGWMIVAGAATLIIIFYYIHIHRAFPILGYAVRDRDIIFRRGWIIRSTRICPFNRTQNCSVQSGPVERRFGLASLVIYTAGTEGADMRIPGLLQEEAGQLRTFILTKIHREQDETI